VTGQAVRLIPIERDIERLRSSVDLAEVSGRPCVRHVAKHVDAIEAAIAGIKEALASDVPTHPTWRSPTERVASLVVGLERLAHSRGAELLALDSLRDLIRENAPESDGKFWAQESPEAIGGLIRWEKQLREELSKRLVAVWLGEEDNRVRLIDRAWLTAHADIYRWVTTVWGGGVRCRACGMYENAEAPELVTVDIARRGGNVSLNGRRQLAAGIAHVHEECEDLWRTMVAVAEQYSSEAEAEAADAEAGREPRASPASKPASAGAAGPRRKTEEA
jgi:hypothetical protein